MMILWLGNVGFILLSLVAVGLLLKDQDRYCRPLLYALIGVPIMVAWVRLSLDLDVFDLQTVRLVNSFTPWMALSILGDTLWSRHSGT